jgi:nicotinate-nucleotide adenylyltransferase
MNPMGIFGGTFDPIHYGHLRTAFEILQALHFDEVRFMPCGHPPHRVEQITNAELRLKMVRVATKTEAGFVVDDRELLRDGPSYSVDTLTMLREEFPLRPLGLIIGMDAFLDLPKWYRWREILQLSHIIVAHRPGWHIPSIGPLRKLLASTGTHRVGSLHQTISGHIFIHNATQLNISSSEIRKLIAAGGNSRFLMPDGVRELIDQNNCYAPNESGITKHC